MRLAVIGAGGWVGGLVTREARGRGHDVTEVRRATADINDHAAVASAVAGHDALVVAYRTPSEESDSMRDGARSVMAAGVKRIVWVGATGVLRVPGGGPDVVDLPQFPADWRPRTLVHRDVRDIFRAEGSALDWTYVSPPREMAEGERTGRYRTGVDEMLMDDDGMSRISVEDFAVAIVDLLETGGHAREHVTFAY